MKKTKSGISLIVLVITVLVIAILAATVIITISNTNVISQTSQATFKSDMSSYKEAYELYITSRLADDSSFDRSSLSLTYSEDADTFSEIFGEVPEKYQAGLQIQDGKLVYETEDETEKTIVKDLGMEKLYYVSKEKNGDTSPYLGCYVEIDGEYGIIFADLLYGGKGTWSSTNTCTYEYDALDKDILKDYTISSTKVTPSDSKFGENYVLKVAGDTRGKKDRFYVMALSDINTGTLYCWYDAAYDSGIPNANSQVTSTAFGTGRANTNAMIIAWNKGTEEGGYGAQDDNSTQEDVWGVIQDKVAKGWFVPSKDEWSAFAVYLKGRDTAISTFSYYGLKEGYWSSSLASSTGITRHAWFTYFSYDCLA